MDLIIQAIQYVQYVLKPKPKPKFNILLIGLDDPGKKAIFNYLCENTSIKYQNTIGRGKLEHKKNILKIHCVGGEEANMDLLAVYFSEKKKEFMVWLIFVVKTNDNDEGTINKAKNELHRIVKGFSEPIVLIMGNDDNKLKTAAADDVVRDILDLNNLNEMTWQYRPIKSKTGDGINESIDWLVEEMKKMV
uniref:Uncharacterized protein n=1 Tax=Panagrolaimus davidi TaxID=227884 RepID=A0A914QPM5_9BILA